jgi:hypothetical protein
LNVCSGEVHLDPATVARLAESMREATAGTSYADLVARRDALLTAVVAATHPHGRSVAST